MLKSRKSKSKWKTISQTIIIHHYKNQCLGYLGFGGQLGIKIISFSKYIIIIIITTKIN